MVWTPGTASSLDTPVIAEGRAVGAVAIDDGGLKVRTTDFSAFAASIAGLIQTSG